MAIGSLPNTKLLFTVSFLPAEGLPWNWRIVFVRYCQGSYVSDLIQRTDGQLLGIKLGSAGVQLDEALLFDQTLTSLVSELMICAAPRGIVIGEVCIDAYRKPIEAAGFIKDSLKRTPVGTTILAAADSLTLQLIDCLLDTSPGRASNSLLPMERSMCMLAFQTDPRGDPVIKEITMNPGSTTPTVFAPEELEKALGY